MIGKSSVVLFGSIPFVTGRVTSRPWSILRQDAALARRSSAGYKRHAAVFAAQANDEKQDGLQVFKSRSIADQDYVCRLACALLQICMWQLLVKYMQALQPSTRATAAQNYKEQVLVPVCISEPLARQQHVATYYISV